MRQAGDVPVLEALRFRLRSAELLLVLDNCEHLLDACAQLAGALLASSPGLRVLATSREPLGVPGEAACPVPPLALPAEEADPVAIAGTPAVRLFLDRGSAARPGASLAGAPVAVIGRICRELDGLPLAIELAAARTSMLSVEEVEAHLADRFRFLAYRRPVADPRHQALKTAIDWSYELLPAAEQRRLRRAVGVRRGLRAGAGGAGVLRRRRGRRVGPGGPAGQQVAGGRRDGRGPDPVPAAGDDPPVRCRPSRRGGRAPGRPGGGTPRRSSRSRSGNATWPCWPASTTTSAPPSAGPCRSEARPGRGWPGRWAASGWPAGSSRRDRAGWNARSPPARPTQRLRADLLRLLGVILSTPTRAGGGHLVRGLPDRRGGRPARGPGPDPGAAIGNPRMLGRTDPEALSECEAAAVVLDAEGDLEGLAEAWFAMAGGASGSGDGPAAAEALERATSLRGGKAVTTSRRRDAASWLVAAFQELPVPADVAIGRAERYLEAASGDPWAEAAHPPAARAALRLRRPLRRRPRGDHARPVRAYQVRGENRLGRERRP